MRLRPCFVSLLFFSQGKGNGAASLLVSSFGIVQEYTCSGTSIRIIWLAYTFTLNFADS